jgi:hypothetical protein
VFVVAGEDRYEDRFVGGAGYDTVRGGDGDDVKPQATTTSN